jgi:uncharacterized protein YfdQ (DUF2303 family)
MIEKDTLQSLMQGPAIEEARASINAAMLMDGPGLVALPDNFDINDLENKLPHRRRARGTMTTPSIEHFAAYTKQHAEDGATVFVNKVTAVAVLNLGTPDNPGQADNAAMLSLEATAAYKALYDLLNLSSRGGVSQRQLAEFLEDWAHQIACQTGMGDAIETRKACDAVRRITIESARKVEAEEQSLSAERSVMESVAATSKNAPLPEFILFSCAPFACLSSRVFVMRLSVRTGDANKPSLSLGVHLIREEEHAEQMAQELADKVKWALMGGENDIPVYLGEYRPRQ